MDIFRERCEPLFEQPGSEREPDYKSVLSQDGSPDFSGALGSGRLRHFFSLAARDDVLVRNYADGELSVVACVSAINCSDLARRGSVAFCVECGVPRCALCDSVPYATLDVRDANRLPQQPAARPLANRVWSEPDGRSNRGVPLGAIGSRAPSRTYDGGVFAGGNRGSDWRSLLLPPDGKTLCRPDLNQPHE